MLLVQSLWPGDLDLLGPSWAGAGLIRGSGVMGRG